MKKFGFTLAEVLITLGIIGVVAALTAPSLVLSSRNEANAAKLAVIVSNLENALTNAIATESANDIYGTRLWTNTAGALNGNSTFVNKRAFIGELSRYMNVAGTIDSVGTNVTTFYGQSGIHDMSENGGTGNSIDWWPGGDCFPILLKNGGVIFIRIMARGNYPADIDARIASGTNYMINYADIFIDVNGNSAPNTFGRDIFAFQISEKGILYPLGGMDVAIVDESDVTHRWDVAGNHYTCLGTGNNPFGTVANSRGIGCTARLVQENYKMNY